MNCFHLDLNIDPLSRLDLLVRKRHTKINFEDINPELIKFFETLNLRIHLAEIFYSHPYYDSPIHIDTLPGDFTKLNWQYRGSRSKMNWYRVLDLDKKDISITPIGTNFVSYSRSEVEIIETNDIKFPSLVQAGVPHNIKNDYEERWVLSIVFKFIVDNRRPTMKESIVLFRDLITD